MDFKTFNSILDHQLTICKEVLEVKAGEYATSDRLHNFKVAAAVEGRTTSQALCGMMVKHTVSIYDMVESEESFTRDVWLEKITDHINYLILLRAIIEEDMDVMPQEGKKPDPTSITVIDNS